MRRFLLYPCLALACGTPAAPGPAYAEAEPTKEECTAAMADARRQAEALPPDNLSRYFAERALLRAQSEAGNGEFDDCMELAAEAATEVKAQRHVLPPGRTLKVLKADETPDTDFPKDR